MFSLKSNLIFLTFQNFFREIKVQIITDFTEVFADEFYNSTNQARSQSTFFGTKGMSQGGIKIGRSMKDEGKINPTFIKKNPSKPK